VTLREPGVPYRSCARPQREASGRIDTMLNGNTNNPIPRYRRHVRLALGLAASGGLEYALTDHWMTYL